MLYNVQRKKLCRHLLAGGALCVAALGVNSCSDTYDLDSEQPTGLNSIYGYMEEQGKYSQYLRLIDDLGQADVLSKTGSVTMFVADDAAFDRFFKSNKWGVKNYDELSLAQKKLLLNTSMLGNPYTTSMLSSAAGDLSPVQGEVFRRSSSSTIFDSILVVPSSDPNGILPSNPLFDEIRANRDSIVLFTDASNASILHFTAKFLSANKLESTDIDFLYNQPEGTRQHEDVYVNNTRIIHPNIFCKNGFIHQVDEVLLPLDNMAEVIRTNKNATVFSSIVERFAAPKDSIALTESYRTNYNMNFPAGDTVFVKRYFSDRSYGDRVGTGVGTSSGGGFTMAKGGATFDASLKFDPGWNSYNSGVQGKGSDLTMEDMAVMLVPTDAAMNEWWNNGSGKVIKDFYGTLEATPNSVIADLVRVNQLASFVSSVPSVFPDVKNDAQEALGIEVGDVDSVILACNGAVYLTNKVFAPTSYSSVLFPAVVDTANFRVIKNAIDNLDYSSYLNSMVAEYIFLLPTNNGLLSYVDPVSYGQNTPQVWEFHFDATKSRAQRINADVYECILNDDGTWTKGEKLTRTPLSKDITNTSKNRDGVFRNRFEDMLNNIIVVEGYKPGKKYYKTKGNTFVRVDGINQGSKVYGTWQQERNQPLPVVETYSMENGTSLVLDGPIMGTRKSVAMTLAEHPEFSEFLGILQACGAVSKDNTKDKWQAGDQKYGNLFNLKQKGTVGAEDATSTSGKATYLLNNYHYTIYAPTNKGMQEAYALGLPSIEDHDAAEAWDEAFNEATEGMNASQKAEYAAQHGNTCVGDSAARVAEAMLDFVKHHIQDNSIFIDEGFTSGDYETGKTELIPSTPVAEAGNYEKISDKLIKLNKDGKNYPVAQWFDDGSVTYYDGKYSPGRPYKLKVNVSSTSLSVTDASGNKREVDVKSGLYNLMAREYWFDNSSAIKTPYEVTINNSSSVVIHAIDGPLVYDVPGQFTYKYKPLTSQ